MGKSGAKGIRAVRVPHDGPIDYFYHQNKHQQAVNSTDYQQYTGINEALQLLQRVEEINTNDDDSLSLRMSNEVSPSVKLVKALLSATQIRSQLHALQAYRSTIIHLLSQSKQQDGKKGKFDEDPATLLGTCRLLFELAMSVDANTPFRRAIHSSLEALNEIIPSDDIFNIKEQVVDSVLCLSESQHPNWWTSPVGTLFEALQYQNTKHILVVWDISSDESIPSDSMRYVGAVKLLQHATKPLQPILEQQSFANNLELQDQLLVPAMFGKNIVEPVEQSLKIAATLKLLLTPILSSLPKANENQLKQTTNIMSTKAFQHWIGHLELFLRQVMTCRATHSDGLSIAGVTYAQTLMCGWIRTLDTEDAKGKNLSEWVSFCATRTIENILQLESVIPPLNILAMVQGIAATLPNSALVCGNNNTDTSTLPSTSTTYYPVPILMDPLASYLLEKCRSATDSAVRLSALRGFHTLLTRCHAILKGSISTATPQSIFGEDYQHIQDLTKNALEICLQTWENPPGRQVENAVPALFENIVSLLQLVQSVQKQGEQGSIDYSDSDVHIDSSSTKGKQSSSSSLDALVERILAQPPNRKGRYLALETLLPVLGSKALLAIGGDELIESFISGIGDRGHNAGAIADLLGKLLSRLREEMNSDAGIKEDVVPRNLNKKQRRKLEREMAAATKSNGDIMRIDESTTSAGETSPILLPEWIEKWAPHVARGLLSSSSIRRKQVAAFCIPLLVTIVGGPTYRLEASYAFAALLDELDAQHEMASGIHGSESSTCESYAGNQESISDRFLWAKLEIARQSSLQKLTTATSFTNRLYTSLAKNLPKEVVMSSLTHAVPFIRVVAFAALETVIPTYDSSSTPLQNCETEMEIWKSALPYALKSGKREYIANLLQLLSSLLTRVSMVEAECYETDKMNLEQIVISDEDNNDAMQIDSQEPIPLPILTSFVCDFLLSTITLKQAAYPGTVAEKEGFVLPLLRCIISFASECSEQTSDTNNKPKRKAGLAPRRRLHPSQVVTKRHIMNELFSTEVFAALLSLLDSMWDNTRAAAYELICGLVRQAHEQNIPLPSEILSSSGRQYLEARAMHLASSPRQREADTGARMLSFAYASLTLQEKQIQFLDDMVKRVANRVTLMEKGLGLVLDGQGGSEPQIEDGRELPLAHGLIQALRLIIEFDHTSNKDSNSGRMNEHISNDVFEQMALTCCRSIEVSLKVVADVKEGETIDGLNSEISTEKKDRPGQAPLNVNTGAIGANGMFSSVKASDKEEERKRFAMQRVIVGSWLLTKEACAALATTISVRTFQAPLSLVERTGSLLISTLTSLKHQGAAFAAHKALQKIATSCANSSYDTITMQMPSTWAQRLLHEISSTEKVRDSTLRRSTGYGLGFLSIMRSEPPASVAPRTLCPFILANVVKIALPPKGDMELFMKRFDFHTASPFSYPDFLGSASSGELYTSDANYESRSRVHALNVLRLIILDAPLAAEVSKFVGDSIMASILGYNDSSWAVRNSSTMVFAAAMVRVVDADKNANRKDVTSGNAITANELFRTYPVLSPFLISVMREGVDDMKNSSASHEGATSLRFIHPPLYPILLLLSRLQPVSSGTEEVTGPFVDIVLESLHHQHHKVRVVASRALANICSGATDHASSRSNLISSCVKILGLKGSNWNAVHGALLAIKALLESSSDPESHLTENNDLRSILYWYASWCNESCECPPPCVAVALETLDDAAHRGRVADMSSQLTEQCDEASWAVISRLEAIATYRDSLNLVGQARLGAVASRVACNCSFKRSVQTLNLAKLSRLFQNDIIDVRLEAVKAFKKPIYHEIDNLLNDQSTPKDTRIDALIQLSQTLLSALSLETQRFSNGYVSYSGGDLPHPPSVRRISRCLLECAYAYKSLAKDRHDKVGFADMIPVEECWETCLKMMNMLEGSDREEGQPDFDTDTSVSGNAVELMGFCICTLLLNNDTAHGGGNHEIVRKTGIFVKAVVRLNDPLSSWRLRHSAALAIETSQLIHWVAPNAISQNGQELSKAQLELYVTTLEFLQDDDPDVRLVAGRILGNLNGASVNPGSTRTLTSVPLLSFEQAYKYAQERFVGSTFTNILLSSVQKNICDLEENLEVFVEETRHSEDTSKSSEQLLNLSTDRKIFEEEDANPFEESLLVSHLVAYTMAHQPSSSLSLGLAAENERHLLLLQQGLIRQCHAVMELVYKRMLSRTHLVHDVTRSNKIFPSIHSLLVICIAILARGGEDTAGLQELAVQIVDEVSSLQEKSSSSRVATLMHPSIMESIVVLANAKPNDKTTLERLVGCCFLLPRLASSLESYNIVRKYDHTI